MDIRQFSVQDEAVIELCDAADAPIRDAEGNPMTITVYGPGTPAYANAQAEQSNRAIEKLRRKGKMDQTAKQKAEENAAFLTACTKAFSPNIEYDGLSGPALFKAVYSDPQIGFIAEQVAKFLGEWANFKQGSTAS